MKEPTDEQVAGMLIGIISDGFNRSLGALADAGVLDTRKLQSKYKGVGSEFYDLVTKQITLTAKYGAPEIKKLFRKKDERESQA